MLGYFRFMKKLQKATQIGICLFGAQAATGAMLFDNNTGFLSGGSATNSTGGSLSGVGVNGVGLYSGAGAGTTTPVNVPSNVFGTWTYAGGSSTPNTSAGLVVAIDQAMNAGDTFVFTASFPNGLVPLQVGGAAITNGATGMGFDLGITTRLAFHGRVEADPVATDATVALSGTLYDGTTPNFANSGTLWAHNPTSGFFANPGFVDNAYTGNGTNGTGAGNIPPGEMDAGLPALSSGGSVATFTNLNLDTNANFGTPRGGTSEVRTENSVGIGLMDTELSDNWAWSELTWTFTAGTGGMPAGTEFRFSLDGGGITIPEPSTGLLGALAGLMFVGRRRRH